MVTEPSPGVSVPRRTPLRITFVLADAGIGGGVRVIAAHAERLRAMGHSVCVVATPPAPRGVRARIRSLLRGESAWRVGARRSFLDGLPIDFRVLERFRPVTDEDVPDGDVVIATWWETAEWVAGLSDRKGAKVLFIQGFEINGSARDARLEATWSLPMHKIAVSSWLAGLARDRFHDPDVSLVSNGVDATVFDAPERGKQPHPTVGFVYADDPCKGPDVLARALTIAAARLPALRIVAFGLVNPRPEAGFPASVQFERSPIRGRITQIYSSCDAWLFGSRAEGFGLPVLEAMACRTPVVATPAGAVPEMLASGGGLVVRPEDAEGIARGIERIALMSDAEWRLLSDRAYAEARARSWEGASALFERAMFRAVERSARGEIAGGCGGVRAG